jgi:hypothetical protein
MPKSGALVDLLALPGEKFHRPAARACDAAARIDWLLVTLEAPAIDDDARARLARLLDRHGAQHVTLLIRTIIESEGNAAALVEPVISAVSSVMIFHPEWPGRGLAPGSRLSTSCRRAAAQKKRPQRGATGAVFAETVPWG